MGIVQEEFWNKHPSEFSLYEAETRPLPLLILSKDLLNNFSIKDEQGRSIPLASRQEDSFAALSILASALGSKFPTSPGARERLDRIVYELPLASDYWPSGKRPWSGPPPPVSSRYGWGWYDEQQWRGVETHHAAGKWLTLFTFEFIVLIALPPRPAPRVIKLSYTEPVFGYKRKWLPPRAAPLAVPATGVGHAGSYHLVVHSPTGLEITDGDLLPTAAAKDSTVSEYSYRRRIQPDAAQIYTTTPSTQPGQYDLRLGFIVPYKTLISPTITAGFAATVLTVAATKACQITTEVPSPAVVTLLFVLAPGLLALHLARPTEHPMLTQVLLPIRVLLLLILPTTYVTAYAAAFKYSDTWFWNAAYFSLGLFLAISLATVWTSWRAAKGRRGTGLTQNVWYHSEDDSLRVAKHGKRR